MGEGMFAPKLDKNGYQSLVEVKITSEDIEGEIEKGGEVINRYGENSSHMANFVKEMNASNIEEARRLSEEAIGELEPQKTFLEMMEREDFNNMIEKLGKVINQYKKVDHK